jgi:pSer/pThr/pTyr-binding forkhead associated (FHA) protein
VRLGYGQNSIGRDRDERVSIDFGDASISRKKHCFIIYEPRKREYILRPGDSANLAYLNGGLVSESTPITDGNLIEIGATTLRFVPFCGPDFDWQDEAGESGKA